MSREVRFTAAVETVYIEEGFDRVFFVALSQDANQAVAALTRADGSKRAFGSVKVEARIGASVWTTVLNAKARTWSLPLKKPVRLAEGISEGMPIDVVLTVL